MRVDITNRARLEEAVQKVLNEFGKRTAREDPVVHFYETFLKEYDKKIQKIRGVYYTPEPVVSYIVQWGEKVLHC
jgi:predicted helicase